jgi:hypothetical protein
LQESFSKIKSILNKHNKIIDNLDNKISNIINSVSLIFDLFGDYAVKKNRSSGQVFETLIEKDFFSQDLNTNEIKNTLEITLIDILNSFSVLEDKIYSLLKTESANIEEYLEILKVCLDDKSSEHYIPVYCYNENYSNTLSYMVLNP